MILKILKSPLGMSIILCDFFKLFAEEKYKGTSNNIMSVK